MYKLFLFFVATIPIEAEELQPREPVDRSLRARERWQSAIMNQILLIRMNKENKKLAGMYANALYNPLFNIFSSNTLLYFLHLICISANISATETRRQKLSYKELCSYSAESASTWDDLLIRKNNEKVDDHVLLEAVRGGVPRMRRGEIWQFLIKQYIIKTPERPDEQYWKESSYRSLVQEHTTHQHAILIDLGRRFDLIKLLRNDFFVVSQCYQTSGCSIFNSSYVRTNVSDACSFHTSTRFRTIKLV